MSILAILLGAPTAGVIFWFITEVLLRNYYVGTS